MGTSWQEALTLCSTAFDRLQDATTASNSTAAPTKDLWLAEVAYKRALFSTEVAWQHFSARMTALAEEYSGVEAAHPQVLQRVRAAVPHTAGYPARATCTRTPHIKLSASPCVMPGS